MLRPLAQLFNAVLSLSARLAGPTARRGRNPGRCGSGESGSGGLREVGGRGREGGGGEAGVGGGKGWRKGRDGGGGGLVVEETICITVHDDEQLSCGV